MNLVVGAVAFCVAVLGASLIEYWAHRLMHQLRWRHHARHHQHNQGQGWLGEFRDYALPSCPIMWIGCVCSVPAGIGIALGGVAYSAFAAWAHQLQHERPSEAFWMKQPVHAIHHYHADWKHNFGIALDVWDRVFGTYRQRDPIPEELEHPARGLWQIHWFTASPPLPRRRR